MRFERRNSLRWCGRLILALLTAALVSSATACSSPGTVGVQKGNTAPDFSLTTLDGGADNLRNYRGRVVVLNFFATWCGPCRAEMPDIQAVYGELRERGLVVLAVDQGETALQVDGFVNEFELSFPILLDSGQNVMRTYGVRAFPTTFIIDRKGVIREVIVGGPLTRSAILRMVEGLLK